MSIFKGIFISYILILLIPVTVLTGYIAHSAETTYRQRMIDDHGASLEQAVNLLDLRLRECWSIAGKISTNETMASWKRCAPWTVRSAMSA